VQRAKPKFGDGEMTRCECWRREMARSQDMGCLMKVKGERRSER